MTPVIRDIIHFFIETPLLLWLFHAIKPIHKPDKIKKAGAVLTVLALLPLYLCHNLFPHLLMRFVYRTIVLAIYLILLKGVNWQKALYFSGLCCAVYHAHMNIFTTPLLFHYFENSILLPYGTCFLLYYILYTYIPFNKIGRIGYGRIVMLVSVAACIVYVKHSLSIINKRPSEYLEISVFPILLQLFLIAMIICFENYLKERRQQEESRIQELICSCKMQSIKKAQTCEEDLKHISHDIKNHLLAIKQLSKNSSNDKLNAYINNLIQTYDNQPAIVETGNALLDGLISEKITDALRDNIDFSVILDFRSAPPISDFDLCVIFGNALDNAIEACKKVSEPEDRYISVRGVYAAGQLIVSISNSYNGKINLIDGLPQTSKPSPALHGIGLTSMQKSLKKYDGVMNINIDNDNKYILSIMLPIIETKVGDSIKASSDHAVF